MSFIMLLLIISAFVAWIYFLWTRRHYYRVAWQMAGPLGLPFIGLGLKMMNPERFLQYMEETAKQYKSPFITWMGTKCFLYVNDPETVETIFNSPNCTNKGDFYRFIATAIGDGLFTSSSPRWNKHRRLINPAFSRQTINNFLPIFNNEADVLLERFLVEGAIRQEKIEIYEIIKKSVLEAACQTTMGKKMNFQQDGSKMIFDSYNGITEVCVKRMLSPWLYPDMIFKSSSLFQQQQNVVGVLLGFVESLLQPSKADDPETNDIKIVKSKDTSDGIRKSKAIFIEQVRNHIEQDHLSWEDVRDEANVTIAATFETTSTALYLVCLLLALHPEYQDELYNELVDLFPPDNNTEHEFTQENGNDNAGNENKDDNNNRANTGGKRNSSSNCNGNGNGNGNVCKDNWFYHRVTNEHLERMTYTEMVINEAMRLFAPVPIVLRSAGADFHLGNGIMIPRGTQIGIDIYNMQRSELVWGPEAKQFRPELHFGNKANYHHPFAFVPFTKGLRMCIGYRYALMLMKILIAKIFRNFRLTTDARMDDLVVKGTISLKLKEYPLCSIQRR